MWLKLAAIAPHAKTVNKKFFTRILEVQFRILRSDNLALLFSSVNFNYAICGIYFVCKRVRPCRCDSILISNVCVRPAARENNWDTM